MAVDQSVTAALEVAVAADPGNPHLRVHLASLLVLSGDAPRALVHAQETLVHEPDNIEALAIARDATRALGDHARADAYGRLLGVPGFVADDPSRFVETEADPPALTLDDVFGLDAAKAELRSLHARLLLYGPPGCGKTLLARAFAGELGLNCFVLEDSRLHDAFSAAHRGAPCVLFLDELDALPDEILAPELDGLCEGVLTIAATSRPWEIDAALRRPGRLDRSVLVCPPGLRAREAILKRALGHNQLDLGELARRTEGCSAADLEHLLETTHPLTQRRLEQAAAGTTPSTRAWFAIAHNYALYANDRGQYDDLLAYVRTHRLI